MSSQDDYPGLDRRGRKGVYKPQHVPKGGYSTDRVPMDAFTWILLLIGLAAVTVAVVITLIVMVGWVKFAIFGDMSTNEYFDQILYDVTHLDNSGSASRLRVMLQKIFS